MRPCTDHLKRELDQLAPPLEERMDGIDWKPLPAGLWTPPAVFAEVGNPFPDYMSHLAGRQAGDLLSNFLASQKGCHG